MVMLTIFVWLRKAFLLISLSRSASVQPSSTPWALIPSHEIFVKSGDNHHHFILVDQPRFNQLANPELWSRYMKSTSSQVISTIIALNSLPAEYGYMAFLQGPLSLFFFWFLWLLISNWNGETYPQYIRRSLLVSDFVACLGGDPALTSVEIGVRTLKQNGTNVFAVNGWFCAMKPLNERFLLG